MDSVAATTVLGRGFPRCALRTKTCRTHRARLWRPPLQSRHARVIVRRSAARRGGAYPGRRPRRRRRPSSSPSAPRSCAAIRARSLSRRPHRSDRRLARGRRAARDGRGDRPAGSTTIEVIGRMPDYVSGCGYRIAPVLGIVRPGFELVDQRARGRRRLRGAARLPDGPGQPRAKAASGTSASASTTTCPMASAHLGRDRRHHPHALRKALRVSGDVSIAGRADWLANNASAAPARRACREGGEEARIAGGAVRNALLGQPVADVDIATTTLPEETVARAEAAGFKTVPTGIEHGTITVVAAGRPFEVTTLRADVETDGRRAKVRFGRDWKARRRAARLHHQRALRRRPTATVVDLVGGLADLESRTVRFIGDAETRIREDYLRILRFFRFFAWYGAGRPDAEGAEGLRAAEGRARPAVGRARLGRAEEAAVGARPVAGAAVDAAGGRADADPAGKREVGHRPHPSAGRGRGRSRLAGRSAARLEAIVPPDAARMRALAERLEAVDGRGGAAEDVGVGRDRRADDDRSGAGAEALWRRQAGCSRPVAAGAGVSARQRRSPTTRR